MFGPDQLGYTMAYVDADEDDGACVLASVRFMKNESQMWPAGMYRG